MECGKQIVRNSVVPLREEVLVKHSTRKCADLSSALSLLPDSWGLTVRTDATLGKYFPVQELMPRDLVPGNNLYALFGKVHQTCFEAGL